MRIKSKLDLNKNYQNIEQGALIAAKNVKLSDSYSLISDKGYNDLASNVLSGKTIVGHIIGLDNKIYLFTSDSIIYEYNELTGECKDLEYDNKDNETFHWTYHTGAKITGCVTSNTAGEKILSIGQYIDGDDETLIPLEHINLNRKYTVNSETEYCQSPEIPIANIILNDTYARTIPNGTYVFYIRYRIRKDVYTPWMQASNPIFAGVNTIIATVQGGLKYIDLHKDSARSFILDISFIQQSSDTVFDNYDKFQLGFILTHDDSTVARIWKSFNLKTTNKVFFDYDEITETTVDNMTAPIYELYNVKNIIPFKNNLYISNYKETDFNPTDTKELADKVTLGFKDSAVGTEGDEVSKITAKFFNTDIDYNEVDGYYETIGGKSIKDYNTANNGELIQSKNFDFSFNTPSKVDTTENSDCITFDLKSPTSRPTMCTICNIDTKLKGYPPLGLLKRDIGDGLIGMEASLKGTEFYVIKPTKVNAHPWYNLGLTCAYGSVPQAVIDEFGIGKNSMELFNKDTEDDFTYIQDSKSYTGWVAYNGKFESQALPSIKTNVKNDVKSVSYACYAYVYFTNGGNKYYLDYKQEKDDDDFCCWKTGKSFGSVDEIPMTALTNPTDIDNIKEKITTIVKERICGITNDGYLVIETDDNDSNDPTKHVRIVVNNINIILKKYEFSVESPSELGKNDDANINLEYNVNLKTTTYNMLCSFKFKSKYFKITSSTNFENEQANTLLPLSTYKFYAHLIYKNGSVTNGSLIKDKQNSNNERYKTPVVSKNKSILQLTYKLSNTIDTQSLYDKGYIGWFISCENTGDRIAEGFDINFDGTNNYVSCLEIDTLLYNVQDKVKLYDDNGDLITNDAHYCSSGVSTPPQAFGNCGFIYWAADKAYTGKRIYIKIHNDSANQEANKLYKCTPYLRFENDNVEHIVNYKGSFYNGYKCYVKKPTFKLSSSVYVAGQDIYHIDRDNNLNLTDFGAYIQTLVTETHIIRSGFNLNYLSLTSDINDTIFSVGSAASGSKQVVKVINSQILSTIYELPSMYRDFQVGTYIEENDYTRTKFDNTIRISDVLGEESANVSVFRFYPTSYYNVPTNRGIIIKLISIADAIYVHTQSSLYKFAGTQTINVNDTNLALQEAEPTTAGIIQLVDSQFGYGGILNKRASCVTYSSYFFYDQIANRIYGFGGNEGLKQLDATILTFLNQFQPTNCIVIADEQNNRVLFQFENDEQRAVLSYNLISKTFVSLHTIDLSYLFNSRNNVYYANNKFQHLFDGNVNTYGEAEDLTGVAAKLPFETRSGIIPMIALPDETPSVINSFRYAANEYKYKLLQNYLFNKEKGNVNSIKFIKIYTDICESNKIVCIDSNDGKEHDEGTGATVKKPIHNQLMNYTHPVYDKGYWLVNYFRNIINTDNIYGYKNTDKSYDITGRRVTSDNMSLIYGNWIAIRFDFRDDQIVEFRIIGLNIENYGAI